MLCKGMCVCVLGKECEHVSSSSSPPSSTSSSSSSSSSTRRRTTITNEPYELYLCVSFYEHCTLAFIIYNIYGSLTVLGHTPQKFISFTQSTSGSRTGSIVDRIHHHHHSYTVHSTQYTHSDIVHNYTHIAHTYKNAIKRSNPKAIHAKSWPPRHEHVEMLQQ